jgi:hypothetical protein
MSFSLLNATLSPPFLSCALYFFHPSIPMSNS